MASVPAGTPGPTAASPCPLRLAAGPRRPEAAAVKPHVRRSPVTDNRMKDRVKVMLGTSPDGATSEHALVSPTPVPGLPTQALQVLTMAQRTAEEHVATAHQQADKIR